MQRRIVYLSWPAKEISGGIKLAFRHVEALLMHRQDAVIATSDGIGPTWFSTRAPVISIRQVQRESDILVFPENNAKLLQHFKDWPNPKVVFCQNQFMACRGLAGAKCYGDYGVTDILAEGRHAVEFCERRCPSLRIASVPAYVDTNTFRPHPAKKLQIAFAPRKRSHELEVIKDLFRGEHPQFSAVPWVPIADCTERQVADILADSAVYLSLCRFEAYPLSLLEALASGCIVAGFTGFGGRIYATSANGFWAAEDDCLDCATQLHRAVAMVAAAGNAYYEMSNVAITDARKHNRKKFDRRVVEFWRGFLDRLERPATPAAAQHEQELSKV
jgi:hypothetical protein